MDENSNPFAPPGVEVADVAAAGSGLELAGRGARFIAALVDGIVQGLVFGAFAYFTRGSLALFSSDSFGTTLIILLASLAVFLLVQGWLLVQRGQTIGKSLLGLRIVRPDGRQVGPARLLGLRYALGFAIGVLPLVGWLYSLVDALLIFRESRRCLHDQIADTVVVRA